MKKVKVQDEEGIGVCAHARAGSVGGFGEYGRLRSPLNHKHPPRLREKEENTVFSELSSETHEESQPPSRFSSFVITGTTGTEIETETVIETERVIETETGTVTGEYTCSKRSR